MPDIEIPCVQCKEIFFFTEKDQEMFYQRNMFAAVDNTVVLPAYLIANAAVYYNISEHWRLQANIENLTDRKYFANADNNTNISPGAPRNIKLGVTARF